MLIYIPRQISLKDTISVFIFPRYFPSFYGKISHKECLYALACFLTAVIFSFFLKPFTKLSSHFGFVHMEKYCPRLIMKRTVLLCSYVTVQIADHGLKSFQDQRLFWQLTRDIQSLYFSHYGGYIHYPDTCKLFWYFSCLLMSTIKR